MAQMHIILILEFLYHSADTACSHKEGHREHVPPTPPGSGQDNGANPKQKI